MTARPIRRALVPLVVVAVIALVPTVSAAEPLSPTADDPTIQTPAEEQPTPDSADSVHSPVPSPPPTLPPDRPTPSKPGDPLPAALDPLPPPPVPEPEPEPEVEPVPVPVPDPIPIPLPPPPVPVLPPGRAAECDVVTAPVPVEVTVLASGIRVHPCLASRVTALVELAARHSVVLTGGGWRSHQRQIALRRAHCGTSDYAIWEMPSGRCNPPTARPGRSRHERGLAVDFNNCSTRATQCFLWLNHHAPAYGLYNLPSEPWHWSVDGS